MTTHAKTICLARLIGLEHKTVDARVVATRAVARTDGSVEWRWYPWRPYECEPDLEPIKAWLKTHHPGWQRSTGCDVERDYCEAFCDAVLAAFDKQHEPNAPAEHNDAMRDSIGTHSDAITSELLPYGTAAKNRRQFQRLSRLRCAAERRARYFDSTERCEACRSEWRERARIAMGVAEYWKKRYYTVNATNTALGNLRDRAKKAEAECDKLRDQVDDAKHRIELAESALADKRRECLGLHEELVRITGEIAAGDTSGEIERLRGDVGFFKGALERAGAAHKDAIQLLTETEADRDRLQAALSGRHRR